MSLNVNTEVTDPFYRYKMPRLIAKVEGKGNGIKTVIVNMVEVAKALDRPPTYPTKFFGCELGAQTQFDFKNERYIVNGSHDASKLQSLLDIFIKKFVLCPSCSNPETKFTVKKTSIGQRCIACGYNGQVDMRHKLTTFILKNPPDMDLTGATPTKGGKKSKKEKGKKHMNGDSTAEDRTSPEVNAQEQMAAQRASGGVVDAPPVVDDKDDDDEDWIPDEDVSADAIKQRMEELSNQAKIMAMSDDLEKSQEERLEIFYQFVKASVNDTSAEKEKEIVAEAERLEIKDKAVMILVELLLDDKILQQLKQYRRLFLRFVNENPKAQRYFLGGLEQLVGKVHANTLLPKMPHILKSLYDNDILDEEIILEWDKKASKKYVDKKTSADIHEKAAPFIKWLKEAEEEESDSEEGEEENLEVVYSTTEKVGEHIEQVQTPKVVEEDAGDDEIDIDAI